LIKLKKYYYGVFSLTMIESENYHVIPSEMLLNGFNDSTLAWYIRYILDKSEDIMHESEDIIYQKIGKILNSKLFDFPYTSIIDTPLHDTDSFSAAKYILSYRDDLSYDIDLIELSDGEDVKLSDEVRNLYDMVFRFVQKNNVVYEHSFIEDFLRKYYDVSRNYVFNTKNTNLNNLLFRKSKTIENLNCIGKMPWGNEKMQEEGYSRFNVCSPYACAALDRVVYNIIHNINRIKDNKNKELQELRTEIFITQMNRSFTRFTSYDFKNYRVSLNRHSGDLISVPYNQLSSLEEVKPLRLFEKIISYVGNRLNEAENFSAYDKLILKVAIIGHTEQSHDFEKNTQDNRELLDLLRVVIKWYSNKYKDSKFPKFELSIENYVNKGDIVNSLCYDKPKSFISEYKIDGNVGRVVVLETDYFAKFYFSKKELKKICTNYDLIFILDCPWMTVESYELKNRGLLDFYCDSIQNEALDKTKWDTLDSDKRTVIQELDTQFNRITSSDSIKSGEISRIFRDDIIKSVKEYIENFDKSIRKDAYIFTSEKDGVDYSYLASYPLTRKEIYGGKDFTISHFSNRRFSSLPVGQNRITIKIRLWSILKYLAVSYAFIHFQKDVREILCVNLSPESFFELLRCAAVQIEMLSELNSITISAGFSKKLDFLMDEMKCDSETFKVIESKLYDKIDSFCKALYIDGVFSDKNNFGDNVIKTGFEMNIRSAAQDVNTLLFVYYYRLRRKHNSTGKFVVNWKYNKDEHFIDLEDQSHCFRDKRLYEMLFDVLQDTSKLGMGTFHTLYTAGELFDIENMEKHILENIVNSCRAMNYTESNIYRNALEALEQI